MMNWLLGIKGLLAIKYLRERMWFKEENKGDKSLIRLVDILCIYASKLL